VEALAAIQRLFASDVAALKVITGLIRGMVAEGIRRHCDLTAVEYDTTRRRRRRTMLRHGLAWFCDDWHGLSSIRTDGVARRVGTGTPGGTCRRSARRLAQEGRERNIARQEVRAFLNEAIAASEEGSAEHCRPTAPAWIGFPAFRESFELPSLPSARQCFSCLGPPPALTGRAASETRSKRLLRVQLSCCRQASPMSPLGALQPMADGAAYGRRCPFAVTRCDQPRRL